MIEEFKDKWDILIAKGEKQTLLQASQHWVDIYHKSIKKYNRFAVALSGGTTPKMLYRTLTSSPFKEMVDWRKICLFWSDERNVIPSHPDSNYHMAMNSGFEKMPIPHNQIFRMPAETCSSKSAKEYEELIKKHLKDKLFDLVMLGLGEDGHIASLFPESSALEEKQKLVTIDFIKQTNSIRMTLTYPCIENSQNVVIYAWGEKKEKIIQKIFCEKQDVPASRLFCKNSKITWLLDNLSSKSILNAS